MRVYRTRHQVYLNNATGIAYFDADPPVEGARPVGLPRWDERGAVAWQTWWSWWDDSDPQVDDE
jgi:hypothetical protein